MRVCVYIHTGMYVCTHVCTYQGFLQDFAQGGGKMTYYSMAGGGKDLSVSSVDLQCTCHFFNTNFTMET